MLQLSGQGLFRQIPLSEVNWPSLPAQGGLFARFTDGSAAHILDEAGWPDWHAWLHARDLLAPATTVKARRSWPWTALATALLLMVAVLSYWWGLPLAATVLTRP